MKYFSFFLSALLLLLIARPALAQTMENDMYKIQMGDLNSISGNSSSSNYNLSITSGETASGLFEGTNYKVKAGFQYVPRTSPFSFSISNTLIDFGSLTPTNPVTRATTLSVNNTSAKSFKVTGAENHPLLVTTTGANIPDTTCDDGKCSEAKSGLWANTLTYGFGYRCENSKSCVENDNSFAQANYFKQFSDSSHKESAATILSGGTVKGFRGVVTYKLNISSSQLAGVYINSVTYVATPGY